MSGNGEARGERSGRSFHLGDRVRVQVARVDLDDKKIDLELVDSEPPRRTKSKTRTKPQTKAKTQARSKRAGGDSRRQGATAKPKSSAKTGLRRRRR